MLFTKHMDTAAKLNSLVQRFGCEFRDGRAEKAPQLKKAGVAALAVSPGHTGGAAESMTCLPHLMNDDQINKYFPRAEPDREALGEPDHTPEEELSDPVPGLRRHA